MTKVKSIYLVTLGAVLSGLVNALSLSSVSIATTGLTGGFLIFDLVTLGLSPSTGVGLDTPLRIPSPESLSLLGSAES